MKTILASTYAVNPYKGSEDGMGWNYVYQIARFNKVIAVTRENNKVHIDKYMSEFPDEVYENITFLYFDLPKYKRFWKRGSRGAMVYFLLWQKGIVNFVKNSGVSYDIAHNLNFHNDWTPSYLWKLGKPFVWGPIGHHPNMPSIFSKNLPISNRIKNKLTWACKNYFWKVSSAVQNTVTHADYIWCMNDSVSEVLDLKNSKYHISPSVATEDYGWNPTRENKCFDIISAGRLVPLKGFDLTIKSFALFIKRNPEANARLTIVGDGPERANLLKLIRDLGVSDRVSMMNWVKRDILMQMMKSAAVFLFPSHEGAGMVVPEALSFGLPIVTIDNCGPGQFVKEDYGFVVSTETYESTVKGLADSLHALHQDENELQNKRVAARKAFKEHFEWKVRGNKLRDIYTNL